MTPFLPSHSKYCLKKQKKKNHTKAIKRIPNPTALTQKHHHQKFLMLSTICSRTQAVSIHPDSNTNSQPNYPNLYSPNSTINYPRTIQYFIIVNFFFYPTTIKVMSPSYLYFFLIYSSLNLSRSSY